MFQAISGQKHGYLILRPGRHFHVIKISYETNFFYN